MAQKDSLIDTKNAAIILGVSPATVRNWIKSSLLTVTEEKPACLDRAQVVKLKKRIAEKKISRLTRRANKSKATTHFIPVEYLCNPDSIRAIRAIADYALQERIPLDYLLFLISLNWLIKEGVAAMPSPEQLRERDLNIRNLRIREEMFLWSKAFSGEDLQKDYSFLMDCSLPLENDRLGLIYQSLLSEGKKSRNGSYYTPYKIVHDTVREHVRPHHKVLDPCCGTGQFLLEFAEIINDPGQIYGFDVDQMAVRIARLNLLMRFRDCDFAPQIYCRDMLFSRDVEGFLQSVGGFDVIATNPPWGYHFSGAEKKKISTLYPQIQSMESYSLFLHRGIGFLKEGGILSFILPESILHVKTHRDIRQDILARTNIRRILCLGTAFKKVFTPVIRLDLKREQANPDGRVQVCSGKREYECPVSVWREDKDFRFTIYVDDFSSGIIGKIFSREYCTLKENADWALGVVTGNNAHYLKPFPEEGLRGIYAGKNVQRYTLSPASYYINFKPEEFQQVAPLERYFAREKLIYRFVSNKLIFAYDDRQELTLNSANIVIPRIPDYPIKAILGLFNSSLYQFLYQKKFSGVKVLRSYLEELPLPLLSAAEKEELARLVDALRGGAGDEAKLDSYVFSLFSLTGEEKLYVTENIK